MKGYRICKTLMSSEFRKKFNIPIQDKFDARKVFQKLLSTQNKEEQGKQSSGPRYFVGVQKPPKENRIYGKNIIMVNSTKTRNYYDGDKSRYYMFLLATNKNMRNLLLGLIIFGAIAFCLFPVWPMWMKKGVWYIAVTFLLFMLVLIVIRLLVWLICWCFGFRLWILPNIFDDTRSVADSFKPVYSLEKDEDLKVTDWLYRFASIGAIISLCYYVYIQPNEYHREFLEGQSDFLKDLYSGNLLPDRSDAEKNKMDEVIPEYEDLLKEEKSEEELEREKKMEELINDELQIDRDMDAMDEGGNEGVDEASSSSSNNDNE